MKNYWSLSFSRAVSLVIMRVDKPKVEYKLALKEKPQGSILTYYYKRKNLTRINWLNTRLIIASNKTRHEIPFKTKRVKYSAFWKKSTRIVKESKLSFFYHVSLLNFFLFPPPQFCYFRSSFLNSLLIISIVFPPPPPPHPPPHPPPPPPHPPPITIEMRRRCHSNLLQKTWWAQNENCIWKRISIWIAAGGKYKKYSLLASCTL